MHFSLAVVTAALSSFTSTAHARCARRAIIGRASSNSCSYPPLLSGCAVKCPSSQAVSAYDGLYGRVDKLLRELENPDLHDIGNRSFVSNYGTSTRCISAGLSLRLGRGSFRSASAPGRVCRAGRRRLNFLPLKQGHGSFRPGFGKNPSRANHYVEPT
jgi:hypothetical protein